MHVRHVLGRHFFGVFSDDEGGGGGEAPQPEYQLPSEVPSEEPQPPPQPPAQPPAEPPAMPPGGAADAASGEPIPKYRLDEAIQQREDFRQLVARQQQQIEYLLQHMGQPAGPSATAQPGPPPISPEDQKIRERLYAVVPELQLLGELRSWIENRDAILGAAQAVPAWQSAETQYWDRYAELSHGGIADAAAEYLVGKGKAGKDLNEFTRQSLRTAFIQWVTSDPARAMRYEREDPSLPKEFWGAYRAAVFDPLRRGQQAQLLNQQPPRVPQGGGGAPAAGGHPPAARPAGNGEDEDAIHARAWAMRDTVTPR
jgi:hypothetical protein